MILAIIAGGKGTRLGRSDLPKPMVPINGKPILEYQIELAKRYGITSIYILSGFMANIIEDYFMDGSKWGVNISHFKEKEPLGTAGAIKQLESLIKERFMVFYGDTVMDINLRKMIEFDQQHQGLGTLLVHPNDHPYDSDLVKVDEISNRIVKFLPKPHDKKYHANLVNAALYILSNEIFSFIPPSSHCDLGKDIFPRIIDNGFSLSAYRSAEYIKDMGTFDRLLKVETDLINRKVERLNNEIKRRAFFIDRDGVINEEVDNLKSADEFELLEGVTEAIQKINHSDFLAIVITNQPVIAKGMCTIPDLNEIHNKMESLLGIDGAYLDKIYYCPHHPEKGYEGEVKELKINCSCRKPNIGMIENAVNEFNIDLNGSYLIGDTTTDILTGINAGLQTILLKSGYAGEDKKFNVLPSFKSENLLSAVNEILSLESSSSVNQTISRVVDLQKGSEKKIFIAVGGLSRSGKSTVINFLRNKLKSHSIVSAIIELDNWIVPVDKRSPEMTVRERYQYEKISKDLQTLIETEKLRLYPYNLSTRSISSEENIISIENSQVVFLDGVISIDHPLVNKISNLNIYVEIEESIRKERFMTFYKNKELAKREVEILYQKRLVDEASIITPTKANADITITF
jgi:mannose-1-phosphate guanylyltransferase/phosphomannomutase